MAEKPFGPMLTVETERLEHRLKRLRNEIETGADDLERKLKGMQSELASSPQGKWGDRILLLCMGAFVMLTLLFLAVVATAS